MVSPGPSARGQKVAKMAEMTYSPGGIDFFGSDDGFRFAVCENLIVQNFVPFGGLMLQVSGIMYFYA